MYPVFIPGVSFYSALRRIDEDLCRHTRDRRCPACGGPLHRADFERKPRGGPVDLPADLNRRLDLCCGRCRRRELPPSCLFLGRKVYWAAIVLLAVLMREQRTEGYTARKLREMFGVCRGTVLRWVAFFREVLPTSRWWRGVRGRLGPGVRDGDLPGSLLADFRRAAWSDEEALKACLCFLADARAGPAG
ncbi:MAG: hypothetical protein QME96_08690 [Myxococcota bacterium]|nr:hypothetical protein [Myxococcota bacterium]